MKMIRCGVIGCGVIAPTHIEGYLALPEVQVVHVSDLLPERMNDMSKRYSIPRCSRDYHDLLKDPDVDVVSVCTDHASHAQIAVDALNAGKHVICEKALGRTPADLQRMVAAADAHPELCSSGIFQHRFEERNRNLKQLIANGAFGRILTVNLNFSCLRLNSYYQKDSWRGTFAGEGGGVLINQAIHYLDLLRFLFGNVSAVAAQSGNFVHSGVIEVEDTVSFAMKMQCGALGVVCATNGGAADWANSLTITGTRAVLEYRQEKVLHVDSPDAGIVAQIHAALPDEASEAKVIGKGYYGHGHTAQLFQFIEAVRNGGLPEVPFREAAQSAALVMAVYAAAKNNTWIEPGTILN